MKQAKLSITVKKVQAKIVSIKLVHPLSCITKQHHSTVQTSVFTYYSFFYNFKVLSYAYLAHMPVNSLLAPPLVNESSAFSVKEVQHRTSPKPQKMKKVQKNGIFSRYKTHHTYGTLMKSRHGLLSVHTCDQSATCGILTETEMHQLFFTHSLNLTYPFPDVLHKITEIHQCNCNLLTGNL